MAVGKKRAEPPKFLVGWKDIATYLGKGVRTVQRYEREMGLPVRRPAGKARAAVVATKAELNAWVAASPYRNAFSLPRLATDYTSGNDSLVHRIEEMRRLKDQMCELREEVRKTVHLLRESIHTVHDGVNDSWRWRTYSTDDFDSPRNSISGSWGRE